VAPKYFETLGVPLLAGRDFSLDDRARPPVAIINEAMAQDDFAGGNPIGRYFRFEGENKPYEVVGVAGNAKYYEIREPPLRTVYLNTFQSPRPVSTFALRTSVDPGTLGPAVRRMVRSLLKSVPVVHVTSLEDQIDVTIIPERLIALLSGAFGGVGALLAAIGIYGLLAYAVTRRTNEIGIRIALGATRSDVSGMVLREALALSCAGVVIGIPIAYWGDRVAGAFINDLPHASAIPIAVGAVTMIAVALVAAYLPARRASHVDPIEALHYE
jgi:predicted permease